jgi:hypothetical protein
MTRACRERVADCVLGSFLRGSHTRDLPRRNVTLETAENGNALRHSQDRVLTCCFETGFVI